MTRVVAKAEVTYNGYEIYARVYRPTNNTTWFRVVAIVKIDGSIYAVRRNTINGLYWARKTMVEMLSDMHGNY